MLGIKTLFVAFEFFRIPGTNELSNVKVSCRFLFVDSFSNKKIQYVVKMWKVI